MSFDLAVWAGDVPESDEVAAREFERRFAQMEAQGDNLAPPSSEVRAFLAELMARFPASDDEQATWAVGPELADISGDFAYLNMTMQGAEEAAEFVADLARRHGLVCFNPQGPALA